MKNKVISLFGNDKVVPNKGVKYSEMVEDMMVKFEDDFRDMEYMEEIIEMIIAAWNFANLSIIMDKKDFNNIMASAPKNDPNTKLLHKFMKYKVAHFKAYDNFIVDYSLKETDTDPILKIITQEQDVYLNGMLSNLEEDDLSFEYEEDYINRYAVIMKPRQPFLYWLENLGLVDDYEEDFIKGSKIYLISDEIQDLEQWLRKKYDRFFTLELGTFHNNKKEWPQKRNYKMFKEWFQVDITISIYDVEKRPVLKDI